MSDTLERIELLLSDVAPDASLADLSGALARLLIVLPPIELIDALTSEPSSIAAISAGSYAHANGFDKFLLRETSTCKLRLHIWWTGIEGVESDLHNHNWDFASRILCGKLTTELFDLSDGSASEGYLHYRYTPVKDVTMRYDMSCLGKQALRKTFRTDHGAGSSYAIDHRQIHRGDPSEAQPTATLVLQSQTRTASTSVFRTDGTAKRHEDVIICEPFTPAETLRKFADLRILLDRHNSSPDHVPTSTRTSRSRMVSTG